MNVILLKYSFINNPTRVDIHLIAIWPLGSSQICMLLMNSYILHYASVIFMYKLLLISI